MSSEQFVCRLQAHADVKLSDMSLYQRTAQMLRLLRPNTTALLHLELRR